MDIFSLLHTAKARAASDLHLVADSPPLLRIDGLLEPLDGAEILSAEDVYEAFAQLVTPEDREEFQNYLELDFGFSLPEVGRLRGNVALQYKGIAINLRLLPKEIPSIDELELPQICKELALKPRGLVVVTGPTGAGKTTTLAAMIHHLNLKQTRHIVTVEDPIEYIHNGIKCAISQRELGSDTLSFAEALKHVLRQDPDVILVGEMRDTDTAAAVLTVAETGHLILTTSHAPSAPQAIERIIDLFPPPERHLAQTRLASLIVGVLCQVLVRRAKGSGRIAAVEVMLGTPAVKNLIRDGKIYQLPNVIRTHRERGMVSLDEALVNLCLDKVIAAEIVAQYCNDVQEVEKLIARFAKSRQDSEKLIARLYRVLP